MAFILDIYKPEQILGTPTGGTTMIPLNSGWAGNNVTFSLLDDTSLNLGNLEPQLSTFRHSEQFGEVTRSYTHSDREMSFKLFVSATSTVYLKNAVQALQAVLIEATRNAMNTGQTNFNSKAVGMPLFLKYQPDSTLDPHYFLLKSGGLDLTDFNNQIRLLQNTAEIPVKLKTSYAAYGDAVILDNRIGNGSGHLGFKGWDFKDGVSPGLDNANSITPKNWQLWINTNDNIMNNNGRAFNGATSATTNLKNDWYIRSQMGLEAFWDGVATPDEDPFFFRWQSPAAVNTLNVTGWSQDRIEYIGGLSSTTNPGQYMTFPTSTNTNNNFTSQVGTWGSDTSGAIISTKNSYSSSDNDGDIMTFQLGNEVASFDNYIYTGYASAGNYRTLGLVHRYLNSTNYAYFYNRPGSTSALVVVLAGVSTTYPMLAAYNPPIAPGFKSKLKISSVGRYTYYYIDDAYVGAFDFNAAPALWAAGASQAGYILKKVGTPGAITTTPSGIFYFLASAKQALALSPVGVFPVAGPVGKNSQIMLDFEYRITGTNTDPALFTVGVSLVQYNNFSGYLKKSFYPGFPAAYPSINVGGTADGQWHRASWSTPQSTYQISSQYILAVTLTSDITKTSTATVDFRKIAIWTFPESANSSLVKLPTVEYVHQVVEARDACIISGLQGDTETSPRLSIQNNVEWILSTPAEYQKLDIGIRKQVGTPAPLVLDVNTNMNIVNTSGYTGSPVTALDYSTLAGVTLFPYSDGDARPYQVKIICSTTAACGFGFMGNALYPKFPVVPNAYLAELPNTSGVLVGLDCGIVFLPPYTARAFNRFTSNFDIVISPTVSTPNIGATYNIYIDKIILTPAEQSFSVDTRQNYNGLNLGLRLYTSLVLDSLLKESTDYHITDFSMNTFGHINPNAPSSPIRLYPATKTSPAPMLLQTMIRYPDYTTKQVSTKIHPEAGVFYSVTYCPAFTL
jgi:hypothetical protein